MYPLMRVRFPALLALASVTTYVACGASDPSKAAQEEGAGGEAGDSTSAGGKSSAAGSQNGGGSLNNPGGQGGTDSGTGATAGNVDGGTGNEAGAGGVVGSAGDAGAGAGGETGTDTSTLPTACPGVIADYTTLVGSAADDAFTGPDVNGKKLIFGLEGADTFPAEHGGDDCLVGGAGDDDFTNSDEFANYYVGGPGADVYHISTTGNYVRIADMEPADELSLKQTSFAFLTGAAGDTVNANQIHAIPGYSTTGTPSGVVEASSLVYDPTTGELWLDADGGIKGSSLDDRQILTILNHQGYTFDIDDFVLE
jgi:hypothetical protein